MNLTKVLNSVDKLGLCKTASEFGYLLNHATRIIIHRFQSRELGEKILCPPTQETHKNTIAFCNVSVLQFSVAPCDYTSSQFYGV